MLIFRVILERCRSFLRARKNHGVRVCRDGTLFETLSPYPRDGAQQVSRLLRNFCTIALKEAAEIGQGVLVSAEQWMETFSAAGKSAFACTSWRKRNGGRYRDANEILALLRCLRMRFVVLRGVRWSEIVAVCYSLLFDRVIIFALDHFYLLPFFNGRRNLWLLLTRNNFVSH